MAKGSHKKFKHSSLVTDLVIPVHNNDCKDFYKTQAAKIVKKLIL
jgi:predicted RNA binding protein YcfA (HicA-like mRNA interferase family)